MEKAVLLTDAQIQRFICDGFLVLKPSVPNDLHEVIDQKFQWVSENESNPGNNISARIPEIQQIVDSPEVRGALISLLGEDYFMIPHRFWHNRKPRGESSESLSNERFDEIVGENSHQDRYSPSSPGRHHSIQYLRIMYYSHDMKLVNGPTHVVPGSQYHASVEEEDRRREIPVLGDAGTVFISHFDLIHAGSPNQSHRVRNMLKLLFAKASEPKAPTWNHRDQAWNTPQDHGAAYPIKNLWRKQWEWLCKEAKVPSPSDASSEATIPEWDSMNLNEKVLFIQEHHWSTKDIDFLLEQLNTAHQALRSSAIYALSEIGRPAVGPLIQILMASEDTQDRMTDLVGGGFSLNDATYALIACGKIALDELGEILRVGKPWHQVNALHAIADIGIANDLTLSGIEECLKSTSDQVVSFAILALGKVGGERQIPLLFDILKTNYDEEHHEEKLEKNKDNIWPVEYAIHFHAALSLVRLSSYAGAYEEELIKTLDHPFGQVSILAGECLKRIGSDKALRALVDFLEVRRWDHSLNISRTF